MDKDLIAIAKITRAAGARGEVRVRPLLRYFDTYVEEKPLYIGLSKQLNREIQLQNKIGMGKKVRFQFTGVETRDDAEALIGQYVFASVDQDDRIYWISEDLLGADVITNDAEYVGILVEMLWLPQNDVYVIRNSNREFLIPVIPEIIKEVDIDAGVIVISPMDGLLD